MKNKDMIMNLAKQLAQNSNYTVKSLAAEKGWSESYFIRVFKKVLGVTPKQYLKQLKIEKIKTLLPDNAVTQALYKAGFNSSTEYYQYANSVMGMPASKLKKGAKDETIYVALGKSVLGEILVAQTQKGVCAIYLGDDEKNLMLDLEKNFPHANFIFNDMSYNKTISQIVGLIENPLKSLNLPLDLHGTAFQIKVWQSLKNIPLGQTKTYSEIASDLNMPKATRAVASACAKNHVGLLIPCHRVVGKSGSLCGYRWGIERKQLILEKEKQQNNVKRFL